MRSFCLLLFFLLCTPCLAYAEEEPDTARLLGAMLMFGFRGADLASASPDFTDMLKAGHIGHVLLFDKDVTENGPRNIVSPDQLKQLTASLRKMAPQLMFIAVDQEGGQVRRLKPQKGFFDLPSAQAMGQRNANETLELAQKQGKELQELGINMDLAPVVDVDTNPFNPAIGRLGRAFSSDAQIVSRHALAFGLGLAKNRVAPVLKHFPGQGCARDDSHLSLPDISQCWNPDIDLLPYAEIFRQGWPGAVMLGHIFQQNLDAKLPASLSCSVVTNLLRQGLGWQGVVISDDLQMKAVQNGRDLKETVALAINAGVDILVFGNNLEWDAQLPQKVLAALRTLVEDGTISRQRLLESWQRITSLYAVYAR